MNEANKSMMVDEDDRCYGGCLPIDPTKFEKKNEEKQTRTVRALPSSVDLTQYVPAPGDQGDTNSCVGWAVGYAMKSYQEHMENKDNPDMNWSLNSNHCLFSPWYIWNKINGGKNVATGIYDAMMVVMNEGCCTLADMPRPNTKYGIQEPNSTQNAAAAKYKAYSFSYTDNQGDVDTIKVLLADGTPVVIGDVLVCSNFLGLSWNNQVLETTGKDLGRGYHAVCLIGYDDNKGKAGAFKFINSWGTGKGVGGYGYISYHLIRTIPSGGKPGLYGFYLIDKIDATKVTLSNKTYTLHLNNLPKSYYYLSAVVTPDHATNKRVNWTSSNPAVATVENRKITAVSVGTTTITATCQDNIRGVIRDQCVVTVIDPWKAEKVSENIPATMVANQKYQVSITMKNTGAEVWSTDKITYLKYNLKNNITTILNERSKRLEDGEVIQPGQSKLFQFEFTLPSETGSFVFDAYMYKYDTTVFGKFQKTVNIVPININASLVSENTPVNMVAGETYPIKVSYKNTGNISWTKAERYQLYYILKSSTNTTIATKRLELEADDTIKPGEIKEFQFELKLPGSTGQCKLEYSMLKYNTSQYFGQYTKTVQIAAIQRSAQLLKTHLPLVKLDELTYLVQFELKNTGNVPWTNFESYELSSNYGQSDYAVFQSYISLAADQNVKPGQTKTVGFKVKLPNNGTTLHLDHNKIYPIEFHAAGSGIQTNSVLNLDLKKAYDIHIFIKRSSSVWMRAKVMSLDLS